MAPLYNYFSRLWLNTLFTLFLMIQHKQPWFYSLSLYIYVLAPFFFLFRRWFAFLGPSFQQINQKI